MKITMLVAVVLLSWGCTHFDVPADATPDEIAESAGSTSEPVATPASGDAAAAGALTQIPEACDLLTAADAAGILGTPAERYEPRVECAYLEQGVGKRTSKQISATVYCPAMQERRYDGLSQEQLVERLRIDMLGGEFQKVDPGIGRGAYIFTQATGIVVFVPTGLQYRDRRGLGGELAIQTTTMKFGDDAAGIDAAIAAARMIMGKLKAAE